MDTELFFCKLTPKGCDVRQLTDTPSWNEQALFTPDGKDVIFMSSRDAPGLFNTFAETAKDLGIPADYDWLLTLPVFEAAFLQPVGEETTDLYLLDLETNSVRRLTEDGKDGWITPEFTWDPQNRRLVWTENRLPPGERVGFPLDAAGQLQKTVDFLSHPPQPYVGGTNALDLVYSIEQRTRVLQFQLPQAHAKAPAASTRCSRKSRRSHTRRCRRSSAGHRRR
jgi:hypothetical protein